MFIIFLELSLLCMITISLSLVQRIHVFYGCLFFFLLKLFIAFHIIFLDFINRLVKQFSDVIMIESWWVTFLYLWWHMMIFINHLLYV